MLSACIGMLEAWMLARSGYAAQMSVLGDSERNKCRSCGAIEDKVCDLSAGLGRRMPGAQNHSAEMILTP